MKIGAKVVEKNALKTICISTENNSIEKFWDMEGGQNRGNKYQGLREGNTQKSTLPLNGNKWRLYKPLHGCLSRSNLLSCEDVSRVQTY